MSGNREPRPPGRTEAGATPQPVLELVNSLLPGDICYFQLNLKTGQWRAGREWLARFGHRGDSANLGVWLETMPVAERDRLRRALQQIAAGERSRCDLVLRMADANGVALDVHTSMAVEKTSDGVVHVHGIQALPDSTVPGTASDAEQQHRLADQLASVVGYAELLEMTELDPRQASYLEEIQRAARQLAPSRDGASELPARIGRALGIEAGQYAAGENLAFGPDELLRILRPLVDRRRRHAGKRARFRLAWEEVAAGSAIPCTVCGGQCALATIDMVLRDNGAVMARDHLPEFFAQGFDAVELAPAGGAGRDGMRDALDTLHRMGGHVAISSGEGETAIHVYLPAPATDVEVSAAPSARRILVVDDNASVLAYVARILEADGYIVEAAPGPDEALARFQDDPDAFAMVISDVTMPGKSGEQMLREMRQTVPALAVLLCTGAGEVAPSWPTLQKPVEREVLLRQVERLLERP